MRTFHSASSFATASSEGGGNAETRAQSLDRVDEEIGDRARVPGQLTTAGHGLEEQGERCEVEVAIQAAWHLVHLLGAREIELLEVPR